MTSPTFNSLGNEWRVDLYPGGGSQANEGNIHLNLTNCSDTEISIQFRYAIKNNNSAEVINTNDNEWITFKNSQDNWGWTDFAPRAKTMDTNVHKHGTLIV